MLVEVDITNGANFPTPRSKKAENIENYLVLFRSE